MRDRPGKATVLIAWGEPGGGAGLGVTRPFDGNRATFGNGVMVAFQARDEAPAVAERDVVLSAHPAQLRQQVRRVVLRRLWPEVNQAAPEFRVLEGEHLAGTPDGGVCQGRRRRFAVPRGHGVSRHQP